MTKIYCKHAKTIYDPCQVLLCDTLLNACDHCFQGKHIEREYVIDMISRLNKNSPIEILSLTKAAIKYKEKNLIPISSIIAILRSLDSIEGE